MVNQSFSWTALQLAGWLFFTAYLSTYRHIHSLVPLLSATRLLFFNERTSSPAPTSVKYCLWLDDWIVRNASHSD